MLHTDNQIHNMQAIYRRKWVFSRVPYAMHPNDMMLFILQLVVMNLSTTMNRSSRQFKICSLFSFHLLCDWELYFCHICNALSWYVFISQFAVKLEHHNKPFFATFWKCPLFLHPSIAWLVFYFCPVCNKRNWYDVFISSSWSWAPERTVFANDCTCMHAYIYAALSYPALIAQCGRFFVVPYAMYSVGMAYPYNSSL